MVPTVSDSPLFQKCRYFNRGYCKYLKTKCKFFHPEEQCDNKSCDKKVCNKRHPKMCKYYIIKSKCRFNDKCFYRHALYDYQTDSAVNENSKMKELENLLRSREGEINKLQLSVENKNKKIEQLEEAQNVSSKIIENLKKEIQIIAKDNTDLIMKLNETKESIEKLKDKFMKDKSDLINQKLKANEDSKLKIREVNDSNSFKDKKLT